MPYDDMSACALLCPRVLSSCGLPHGAASGHLGQQAAGSDWLGGVNVSSSEPSFQGCLVRDVASIAGAA